MNRRGPEKGAGKDREGLRGWPTVAVTKSPYRLDECGNFMVTLNLSAEVPHVKAHHLQRTDVFTAPDLVQ